MNLLDKALDTLHDIAGALTARQLLAKKTPLTEPLKEGLIKDNKTDQEIINMAADTWEEIVIKLREDGRPPITHVAIKFRDQIWSLPKPYRHHHLIRIICYLDSDVDNVNGSSQGFLDENGRYLTRDQALVNAQINNQIKGEIKGILTSEDLW